MESFPVDAGHHHDITNRHVELMPCHFLSLLLQRQKDKKKKRNPSGKVSDGKGVSLCRSTNPAYILINFGMNLP